MCVSELRALACPHCGLPHDLFAVLDGVWNAWPSERWLAAACPDCGAEAQLELHGEHVAIGFVSRTAPRYFAPTMRVRQPGLASEASPDGLLVRLLHRCWCFASRDATRAG